MTFDFGKGGTNARSNNFMTEIPLNADDPLEEVEYNGDLEHDLNAELDALAKGFRERKKREEARYEDAVDTEFWLALCFRSRDEKERFLRLTQWDRVGDKFLDGYEVAKILGVDLPRPDKSKK